MFGGQKQTVEVRDDADFVAFYLVIAAGVFLPGGAQTAHRRPEAVSRLPQGVPFFWLLQVPQVVVSWLLCVGALLALFYVIDSLNFRKHKTRVEKRAEDRVEPEGLDDGPPSPRLLPQSARH